MEISHLKGLVAPVFTPMNEDFTINYAVIPDYLRFLVQANVKNILVNGTTGEGMSQGVRERKKASEAWVEAARPLGVGVMLQVGGAALPDVLELASYAEAIRADCILCLPELYCKPRSSAQLVGYLQLVSRAAPGLPLLYYHFPAQSGVDVNVQEFVSAATKSIPNFSGIKCNLSEGAEIVFRGVGGVTPFLGNSLVLAPAFMSGFDSCIATMVNIVPTLCSDIVQAAKCNDVQKCKELQMRLNRLTDILVSEGDWVPATKAGMELVTGLRVGHPRPPLAPLCADARGRLQGKLSAEGFLP